MGSFQDLLNRLRGNDIPSQMPGAMGGGMGIGFDHGITGNLSDIQNRPFDYGMKGGLKQMPYRGEEPILVPLPSRIQSNSSSSVLFPLLIPRRN